MDTPITRKERWGRRRRSPLRTLSRVGKSLFYGVMAVLAIVMAIVVGTAAVDASSEVVWGTFTESSREYQVRGGWVITGSWQSDDGSLVLSSVRLSGDIGTDGTARAGYRPDAVLGNEVVYTDLWADSGVLVSLAVLGAIIFTVVRQAFEWGDWPSRARVKMAT